MAYTVVSGIITDPNGVLYVNAQITAEFVPSPTATQIPTLGNVTATFPLTILGIRCDSFAAFSMTLADNNAVTDGHTGGQASQWKFNVISQDGKASFSYTTTITGSTQGISAGLKAAAATFQTTNITGITPGTTGNIAKYATATTISDSGFLSAIATTVIKNGTGAGNYAGAADTNFHAVDSTNLSYTLTIPIGFVLIVIASGQIGTLIAADYFVVQLNDGAAILGTGRSGFSSAIGPSIGFITSAVIVGNGASHTIQLQAKSINSSHAYVIENSTTTLCPSMIFVLMQSN